MIDRYSLTATAARIAERFEAEIPGPLEPSFNAAPTHLLPVITHETPHGISTFYWGTSPQWGKNKTLSEKLINVRAEQIQEKISLKKALMKTRCIIPADGFYAWKKAGKKTMIPYRFITSDQEIFSMAGLWEEYDDTEGNQFHTFTIITTAANEIVSTIFDRMPVILNKSTEKIWLNPAATEEQLMTVLTSYPSKDINLYSVSPRISDANANVPSLIAPAPPSDQFGNLTLFD
jgi:putative SOS response-associated peptidase YedK